MARKTLDKWLSEVIADPDKERVTRVVLVHMQGGNAGSLSPVEVDSFKFTATGSAEPKVLADRFRGKAEAYAQDLAGVQTFNIWVFYGTSNEPGARQPFMVQQSAEASQGGLWTEPPDGTGQTMQKMRQNEALFQQVYRRQQTLDDLALRREQFNEQVRHNLMAENMDMFGMMKDLMMQMGNQDHERRMTEMQYRRSSEERKKLLQFAPALVNTLIGKEIFPQSAEDTALIETLAEHITEEQVQMLGTLGIPAEAVGALNSRVAKAMKEKREAEEEIKRLPVYKGKGIEDVTGGVRHEEDGDGKH